MNCRLVDSASRHATSRRNMQQVAKKLNMFNFVQQVDRRDFLSTQHATCCMFVQHVAQTCNLLHMQLVACATSCMSGRGLTRVKYRRGPCHVHNTTAVAICKPNATESCTDSSNLPPATTHSNNHVRSSFELSENGLVYFFCVPRGRAVRNTIN